MDKKEYTETVRPDGTIVRTYNSGKDLQRDRLKRQFDFAENELIRSVNVISNDIIKFKIDSENIKTKKDKKELLFRLFSSIATVNVILKDNPILKDFDENINIDEKIIQSIGYEKDYIKQMREKEIIFMKFFQNQLQKLIDYTMSIDFY